MTIQIDITKTIVLSADEVKHLPHEGYLGKSRGKIVPVEYNGLLLRYKFVDGSWKLAGGKSYAHRIKKNGDPYDERSEDHLWMTGERVFADLIEKHMPTEHIDITITDWGRRD